MITPRLNFLFSLPTLVRFFKAIFFVLYGRRRTVIMMKYFGTSDGRLNNIPSKRVHIGLLYKT